MKEDTKRALIERIGFFATGEIESLEDQIEELHEYLGVVRLAHTVGFKLAKKEPSRKPREVYILFSDSRPPTVGTLLELRQSLIDDVRKVEEIVLFREVLRDQ